MQLKRTKTLGTKGWCVGAVCNKSVKRASTSGRLRRICWFTWEGWVIPAVLTGETSEIVSKAKMSFKRENESMERREWEDASGSSGALEAT